MKKLLLSFAVLAGICCNEAAAEKITINGTEYEAETKIQKEIGAGVIHKRIRINDYPLNVNLLFMDMTNPYARVETTQASETLTKTEALVNASKRLSSPGHKVLGGANANFWCVAGQAPYSGIMTGITYNGNMRNGEIITETNMYSDQWDGGWKHTGIAAVDNENNIYVGHYAFHATIQSESIGTQEIIQVNKICRDNEIAMYNKYYGSSKAFQPVDYSNDGTPKFTVVENVSTEVLLDYEPGQNLLCATDITATVKEVRTDAGTGTLGSHDFALVAKGGTKETLARLKPGDKVVLNYKWGTKKNGAGVNPKIENLIGGNAMVLIGGEYTTFNDTEGYNSQIYSRTAYATDPTGKKLAIIVIDKSTDPIYGLSKGCNTKDMCDILKHYGYTEVVNMDAGGSAEMLVEGAIVNKTTEGTPRAVANGWLMISTAPEDNTITRLEFDSYNLEVPVYSTFRPTILAYNKYGDIVNQDLQGFELSCDASLGTCNGEEFTAGGNEIKANLTATYNGISVSKEVSVRQAELSIRIKPILIDAARKYPIEVTATIEGKLFTYNPANLEWTVGDSEIAAVDADGCLTGLKNGTTTLTGKIGDFTDQTDVTVEIAPAAQMPVSTWESWTANKMTGITNTSISPDGNIAFTYGSPRSPKIGVTSSYTFYSLPDRIMMTFTPSVDISKIVTTITSRDDRSGICDDILPEGTVFAAGESHTIEFPLTCDLKDLISYPLNISSINFYIKSNSAYKGEQSIRINDLHAEYANFNSGVENISAGDGSGNIAVRINPSPVCKGGEMAVSCDHTISKVEIYSISGALDSSASTSSTVVTLPAPGTAGLYIVRVTTAGGIKVAKLLVE